MTFNNTNNPKYNRTCVFKCRYMCYLQINKMLSLREYDLAQRIRIMKCFSRLSPVFLCGAGTGTILFNWYFGATLVLALIVPENGFVRSQLQAIIWWIWLFFFFFHAKQCIWLIFIFANGHWFSMEEPWVNTLRPGDVYIYMHMHH